MAKESMVYVEVDLLEHVVDTLQEQTGWTKRELLKQIDATAPTYDRWFDGEHVETIMRGGVACDAVKVSIRHYENILEVYKRELRVHPKISAHAY